MDLLRLTIEVDYFEAYGLIEVDYFEAYGQEYGPTPSTKLIRKKSRTLPPYMRLAAQSSSLGSVLALAGVAQPYPVRQSGIIYFILSLLISISYYVTCVKCFL